MTEQGQNGTDSKDNDQEAQRVNLWWQSSEATGKEIVGAKWSGTNVENQIVPSETQVLTLGREEPAFQKFNTGDFQARHLLCLQFLFYQLVEFLAGRVEACNRVVPVTKNVGLFCFRLAEHGCLLGSRPEC